MLHLIAYCQRGFCISLVIFDSQFSSSLSQTLKTNFAEEESSGIDSIIICFIKKNHSREKGPKLCHH